MKATIGVVIHETLLHSVFSAKDRARLEALGKVRWTSSEEPLEESVAIELLQGCSVGVGSWHTPFPSAPLVQECPDLRLWEQRIGKIQLLKKRQSTVLEAMTQRRLRPAPRPGTDRDCAFVLTLRCTYAFRCLNPRRVIR